MDVAKQALLEEARRRHEEVGEKLRVEEVERREAEARRRVEMEEEARRRREDEARQLEEAQRAAEEEARRIVTVAIPGAHEKPFDPADLAALARSLGFESAPAPGIAEGIVAAQADSTSPMRILICGSLYLAGEVLVRNG